MWGGGGRRYNVQWMLRCELGEGVRICSVMWEGVMIMW